MNRTTKTLLAMLLGLVAGAALAQQENKSPLEGKGKDGGQQQQQQQDQSKQDQGQQGEEEQEQEQQRSGDEQPE